MSAPVAGSGLDPARVFAEMDRYLEAAKAEGFEPCAFRIAEPLLRNLATEGAARMATYQGVPIEGADEWAWGWMLRVKKPDWRVLRQWFQPLPAPPEPGK